jgi:glycine/D-amino acid oxidase-like deaminating enzyme
VIERPYWWDTVDPIEPVQGDAFARPKPEADRLKASRSEDIHVVDVVIVGGGYTGLAAARRLAKSGASVLVLDREAVGWGASSRNGGQVLTGLKLDPETLVNRYGESRARRLFDAGNEAIVHLETLIADERIACGFERRGHVQAAWKPSHFEAFRAEQALLARAFNHRVELVSRDRQRAEIGSDAYYGALVDEQSAALNPAQYVSGLAAAARRAGACVRGGVTVERIDREGQRWVVATSAGPWSARDVLVATNGYTGPVVPAVQRQFVPIGSYIIATQPLAEADARALLPNGRVAFDSKNFLYYFRITGDRRLLFGGRAEFTPPSPASIRRAAGTLRRGMTKIFPQLGGVEIEYAWGGNVAFTRDQMPHAGQLDGMHFSGGYCGHGIAPATRLGDLIARRMAGEAIRDPLLESECSAVPLYRGRPWFLPLAGAYYKVKDWIS